MVCLMFADSWYKAYIVSDNKFRTSLSTTVEPLIKDTPYKGHNRIYTSIQRTLFVVPNVYLQYICNL